MGHRPGIGAGIYLLDTAHRWAQARGLRETQLRVFVDNPAAKLYLRMGYRLAGRGSRSSARFATWCARALSARLQAVADALRPYRRV
ncbi:MAG: hypothetical protein GAK41_01168 [Burkholderia gladioli]|nr:MAG: hypothetical protein GAK41_01168 [Burkholderia gladioli]